MKVAGSYLRGGLAPELVREMFAEADRADREAGIERVRVVRDLSGAVPSNVREVYASLKRGQRVLVVEAVNDVD